jgi:hypothetical protein
MVLRDEHNAFVSPRRIVPDFDLALVLLGCCERAAHLATVKTKTARLSLTVRQSPERERRHRASALDILGQLRSIETV